jgi:hypothetical protein
MLRRTTVRKESPLMSLQQVEPFKAWPRFTFDPQNGLKAPLGAAPLLWSVYMTAAAAGVVFWWTTRWFRPANLEALLGREGLANAVEAAVLEPVMEAFDKVDEARAEAAQAAEAAPAIEPAEAQAPAASTSIAETAKALVARRKATKAKAADKDD